MFKSRSDITLSHLIYQFRLALHINELHCVSTSTIELPPRETFSTTVITGDDIFYLLKRLESTSCILERISICKFR
jgi:hypothetical protein